MIKLWLAKNLSKAAMRINQVFGNLAGGIIGRTKDNNKNAARAERAISAGNSAPIQSSANRRFWGNRARKFSGGAAAATLSIIYVKRGGSIIDKIKNVESAFADKYPLCDESHIAILAVTRHAAKSGCALSGDNGTRLPLSTKREIRPRGINWYVRHANAPCMAVPSSRRSRA